MEDAVATDLLALRGWIGKVVAEAKRGMEADTVTSETVNIVVGALRHLVEQADAYLERFTPTP